MKVLRSTKRTSSCSSSTPRGSESSGQLAVPSAECRGFPCFSASSCSVRLWAPGDLRSKTCLTKSRWISKHPLQGSFCLLFCNGLPPVSPSFLSSWLQGCTVQPILGRSFLDALARTATAFDSTHGGLQQSRSHCPYAFSPASPGRNSPVPA